MPKPNGDFYSSPILDKYNDKDYDHELEKCVEAVKDGLPPVNACMLVFGIHESTYSRWYRQVTEDIEAGFDETDSRMIRLILALSQNDQKLHKRLIKTATKMAIDDESATMLKFLLETRYDYAPKKKSEVELATKEDTTFNINIVESKKKDD